MRISIEWLNDYIDVNDDVDRLADRLTMAGHEVEGIDYRNLSLDNIVSARIASIAPHPNADKLRVCSVAAGDRTYQVVCGDPSVKEGDIVPLALPGARLGEDFLIRKSKLRGVESEGMLCSEKELGISEEGSGVMKLQEGIDIGEKLIDVMTDLDPQIEIHVSEKHHKNKTLSGYDDSIFEVGLTPNRPDCLSVYGFARELSALSGNSLMPFDVKLEEGQGKTADSVTVQIDEPALCHRYMARIVRGIRISRSPLWMRRRLEASGIRAINNIVDITNYVMLELGQPMHAFDLGKIAGGRIIVRKAVKGETLLTLDGSRQELNSSDLLICDDDKPLALAGVIGGEESAVSSETVDILLESAFFQPETVRRTARRLGLHTESSHRFERGIDIEGVGRALDRAAMLVRILGGGEIMSDRIDNYPIKPVTREVSFRINRCSRILGVEVKESEAVDYLLRLGMKVSGSGNQIAVIPPSFRVDIEREADLIEEVARLKGYDAIPVEALSGTMPEPHAEQTGPDLYRIKQFMADSGFNEVINYSFQSPDDVKKLLIPEGDPGRETIRVMNPISEDLSVMRTTIIPGLLNTAAMNIKKQNRSLRLFEAGKTFNRRTGADSEGLRAAALLSGDQGPLLWKESPDIHDLKGVLENLLDLLKIRNYTLKNCSDVPYLHPGNCARIFTAGKEVALIGEVHPDVLDNFDIRQKVFIFDLDLMLLSDFSGGVNSYKDIAVYPCIERDVAFLVDKKVAVSEIVQHSGVTEESLLEDVELFDSFEGKGIEEGKKSLAFRFRYRSPEKTLTDDEVNGIHQKNVEKIVRECDATVR